MLKYGYLKFWESTRMISKQKWLSGAKKISKGLPKKPEQKCWIAAETGFEKVLQNFRRKIVEVQLKSFGNEWDFFWS